MPHVNIRIEGGGAVVVLCRGKVNALDEPTIDELNVCFRELEADGMRRREGASITEFVDIWYSEATWRNLREIRIH